MIHQLQYTLLNWTSYAFNPKPLRLINHKNTKAKTLHLEPSKDILIKRIINKIKILYLYIILKNKIYGNKII